MRMFNKFSLFFCCLFLCAGVPTQTSTECILLRTLDGGLSAGCGAALVGVGLGTIFIPGCLCHVFAQQNGSTFFGMCACVSYLSGIVMSAGGIKVLYDGIKKLFGFNRSSKKGELLHPHYQIKWVETCREPSWLH